MKNCWIVLLDIFETGKTQVPSFTFFTNFNPTSLILTESPMKLILLVCVASSLCVPRPIQATLQFSIFNPCLKKNLTEFLLVKKIQSAWGTLLTFIDLNEINEFVINVNAVGINADLNKLFLSKFFEMKTLLGSTFFLTL